MVQARHTPREQTLLRSARNPVRSLNGGRPTDLAGGAKGPGSQSSLGPPNEPKAANCVPPAECLLRVASRPEQGSRKQTSQDRPKPDPGDVCDGWRAVLSGKHCGPSGLGGPRRFATVRPPPTDLSVRVAILGSAELSARSTMGQSAPFLYRLYYRSRQSPGVAAS